MTDSERIIQLEARLAQLEARMAKMESIYPIQPRFIPSIAFPDINLYGYKITCGTAQLQNEYPYK